MKRLRFVALLIVGATILGATVLREPIALAAQIVDANIVGPLDADGNVKVHEQGTANVSVQGTPAVRLAREPFQEFVDASTPSGEECEPIQVPRGKRLTIESFSAELGPIATQPAAVYLRVGVSTGVAVRSILLRMTNIDDLYAGDVQTLLFSGEANASDGATYSYAACIRSEGEFAEFRGLVSGYLEPAP